MKRSLSLLVAVWVLVACSADPVGSGSDPASGPSGPKAEVERTFDDYRDAALAKDGERVAELVTDHTIDYYEGLVDLALRAEKAALRKESLIDQWSVLVLRQSASRRELEAMDGADAISFAIAEGLISEDAVSRLSLRRIAVDPRSRSATAETGDGEDVQLEFEFDEGRWRIDIAALTEVAAVAFRDALKRTGLAKDRFLAALIESSTGKPFSPSLWKPAK